MEAALIESETVLLREQDLPLNIQDTEEKEME